MCPRFPCTYELNVLSPIDHSAPLPPLHPIDRTRGVHRKAFCYHTPNPVLYLIYFSPPCFASWAPNSIARANNVRKMLTRNFRCISKPKSTRTLLLRGARAPKPLAAHPLFRLPLQTLSARCLLGSACRHTLTHTGKIIRRHHPPRVASNHLKPLRRFPGLEELAELRLLVPHHQHRIFCPIISHHHLPLRHQQMPHARGPYSPLRARIHCEYRCKSVLGSHSPQLSSKTICHQRSVPCHYRVAPMAPVLERAVLRAL
ncbi:hypothetical protein EV702DRAFT_336041 [Suillus placidus]|uniref:Uncharacterized protein n=1 Tax=Suillus placidus TaxID=48579 RepID=A0A9P7D2A6_9AGAM|nr:hypothetical protein EV702DRAFT_336041 [Suillus placidus]